MTTLDHGHLAYLVRGTRRRWSWLALGGVLLAFVIYQRVEITSPRVHVRWQAGLAADQRAWLERRHDLRDPELIDRASSTWQYRLGSRSRDSVRALIQDPAVLDTGYIDRDTFTADPREIRILWYPFTDLFDRPSDLLRLHQSVWMILGGGALLWGARSASRALRRNVTVVTLLLAGALMMTLPLNPSFVTMGGSEGRAKNRQDFEFFYGGRVRFEKHLSHVMLFEWYTRLEPTEAAPKQSLVALSRFASVWFVSSALIVGVAEQWSPLALRYVALGLLAPSALLYFGWLEFGYLSLSAAAVPLLFRGIREPGMRLEAGSVVAGFGAALHGTGLVSLAGAGLAAVGASGAPIERLRRGLSVAAWGTFAYLGWISLYMMVLELPVSPDPGPAAFSSWRPWLVDEMRGGRVAAALWSATAARDLTMAAWVTGAPLFLVAATLARRYTEAVKVMLWYALPSLLFVVFRWPYDGVGGGMDLIVAGFPAFYALAWVCAHDSKRTYVAAALLFSAHYAFWRVVLDKNFIP